MAPMRKRDFPSDTPYYSIFRFLQHPWSNITDTFLNLEGAASGGYDLLFFFNPHYLTKHNPRRPLVFRSSSLPPLRSFLPKHVPHPHANVLSADAFARGVIRSDTDYSIYTGLHAHSRPQKTMQGLDYAFYKHRSRYHTKYDAMPYMEGGKRALWSMLEGAAGAGRALVDVPLSLDSDVQEREERAVYFDRRCLFCLWTESDTLCSFRLDADHIPNSRPTDIQCRLTHRRTRRGRPSLCIRTACQEETHC